MDEQFVLYDERLDWLAMYLIALVPLWLAYSFQVSLSLLPAFALIAALRPMRLLLGSFTWSGVFAAGACLLLSPILLMAAQERSSGLFDDVSVDDQTLNGIRALVYPAAGLAIMANAWFRSPRFRDANGLTPKRMRLGRSLGFVAVGLALAVSLLPRSQPMAIDEAVGSTEGDETAAAIEDRSDLLSDVLNDRIDPAIFGDTTQQYPRVGERMGQVKPEDVITAVFGTPEERVAFSPTRC